jgi:hypothetical protein
MPIDKPTAPKTNRNAATARPGHSPAIVLAMASPTESVLKPASAKRNAAAGAWRRDMDAGSFRCLCNYLRLNRPQGKRSDHDFLNVNDGRAYPSVVIGIALPPPSLAICKSFRPIHHCWSQIISAQ